MFNISRGPRPISTFQLFLIEGSDIYHLLLVLSKNIIPIKKYNRSYCWSEVSTYTQLYCACTSKNLQFLSNHLLQFLSNYP